MAIKIDWQDLQKRYIGWQEAVKVMLNGGEIRPNTVPPTPTPTPYPPESNPFRTTTINFSWNNLSWQDLEDWLTDNRLYGYSSLPSNAILTPNRLYFDSEWGDSTLDYYHLDNFTNAVKIEITISLTSLIFGDFTLTQIQNPQDWNAWIHLVLDPTYFTQTADGNPWIIDSDSFGVGTVWKFTVKLILQKGDGYRFYSSELNHFDDFMSLPQRYTTVWYFAESLLHFRGEFYIYQLDIKEYARAS